MQGLWFWRTQGSNTLSFEKPDDNDTVLDESGQRRHRQLFGRLLWLDRPDIKNAVCQLSTHAGTATTRDEINIKLRYLIRKPACHMIVGCNLNVPGIAVTPQGSVVVMTDAGWAGDVKDRCSYSGIAVWVKGSVEITWYPVYASSKKQNMVCLSSGESELMALVGGACEGIATRDQWSILCKCSLGTILLCTDSSAALGLVKRKGASRRTRHVDTKVYFMQAWTMEPGQRILKVHGKSQPVAGCLTKIMTPQAAHRRALGLTDAAICRTSMRGCGRSLPTKSLSQNDLTGATNDPKMVLGPRPPTHTTDLQNWSLSGPIKTRTGRQPQRNLCLVSSRRHPTLVSFVGSLWQGG